MTKRTKHVWKDRGWERGEQIEGGNQGHTHFARRSTDPPDEFKYVLKELKRQEDVNRRAMFCNEILAMRTLDHNGVIKVVETNAERFREPEELFLITPRINGTDLEKLVRAGQMSLEDAVRMTLAVLDILDHCHKRLVIHRDIKPCHVILQNDSLRDPVLIDFGLAYHPDTQPSDAETGTDQGRGNRFLSGPEHHAGIPEVNRNAVTDICVCVGLLFYAITQEYPRLLLDTNSKKPHDRLDKVLFKPELVAWKRRSLLQIFDVGFEWNPSRRWQRIDELVERLKALLGDKEPVGTAFELELAGIFRRAETNSDTARMKQGHDMAAELFEVVKTIALAINDQQRAENCLSVECDQWSPLQFTPRPKIASLEIAFRNKVDRARTRAISIVVELSNKERIDVLIAPFTGNLAIFENNTPVRLGSYDLGTAKCSDDVRRAIAPYLANCVAEVLGVDSHSEGEKRGQNYLRQVP